MKGDAEGAMREVREAASALSIACLAHIPIQLLRDSETLRFLAPAPEDFEELLTRIG